MRAGRGGPRAVSPREGGNGRSPRSADDERYIYVAIQAPSLGRERPLVGAPRVGGNHCSPLAVLLPACSVLAFTSAGYRLLAGMFFVCWNPDHWGSSLTLATDTCVCVCVVSGIWGKVVTRGSDGRFLGPGARRRWRGSLWNPAPPARARARSGLFGGRGRFTCWVDPVARALLLGTLGTA